MPSHLQIDSIALVRALPNLLVTRTFSKAYGLAGLRVGYGVAQPALADMLRRTRAPFSISQPAQLAATAALKDQTFLKFTLENNFLCKKMLGEGLRKLGLRYLDSHTNFILVEVGDGAEIAKRLELFGLIVRPVNSYGLSKWLRISVGKVEEIQRLLDAMSSLMQASD
jgi:histidinol-phosphate aminotransferase